MNPVLSIIILTCNQRDYTVRCLESLNSLLADIDTEVLLIDNGSTDNTRQDVEKHFPQVRYLKLDENIGVAGGRNVGLRNARGEYVMLLDNDTIANSKAIYGLLDYLKSHPQVGLVAPRLMSPEGELQKSWKEFPGLGVKMRNVLTRGQSSHYADEEVTFDIEPYYVIGAAQMFQRRMIDEVGYLDESIFYGPEDADFCERIRRRGYRVVYHPDESIIHDWQRMTTRKVWSKTAFRHIRGLLHFYWKHKRIW